jgi:CheY-like chemotaxis protein
MKSVASGHILVVEDDRGVRESLSDALTLEGFDVSCAENGAVALRQLTSGERPCLILLDLMMPVMDGWTFRSALLGDPALAHIPVIIMTAAGPNRADAVPAELILHKPLHMDRVVEAVQEHCAGAAG